MGGRIRLDRMNEAPLEAHLGKARRLPPLGPVRGQQLRDLALRLLAFVGRDAPV